MYDIYCKVKKGLSKEQKEALGYHSFLNAEIDRYCESIFYIPNSNREKILKERINTSIENCNKLNCGQYC